MKSKYIIYVSSQGLLTPIVFPETLKHADVAAALTNADNVTGAGFCFIDDSGRYQCYGNSESLSVESNGYHDSKALNRLLGVDDI